MLFPVPGAPVIPMRYAWPVYGKSWRRISSASRARFSMAGNALAKAREHRPREPVRPSFRRRLPKLLLPKKLARDHQALNFAGAFADGAELHVAIIFFRRVILDESVAAVNLHRFVRDAHRHFSGVELGHAGLARKAEVMIAGGKRAVGEPCRAIGQQARRLNFGGHVRQLELDGLKFGDGFAELLALLGVTQRGFISPLRHAQRESGDGNSAAIENLQGVDEPFAFLAEQIFGGQCGNR